MSPEQIQAVGGAIVAVLAAWQARTSSKVRDLESRLAIVETQRNQYRTKLRAAVQHIREWMMWAMQHGSGRPTPALPAELRDEV